MKNNYKCHTLPNRKRNLITKDFREKLRKNYIDYHKFKYEESKYEKTDEDILITMYYTYGTDTFLTPLYKTCKEVGSNGVGFIRYYEKLDWYMSDGVETDIIEMTLKDLYDIDYGNGDYDMKLISKNEK